MGMGIRVETLEEIVLGETVTTGTAVKGGLTEAIVETGIALVETAIMVVEGEVAVVDEV